MIKQVFINIWDDFLDPGNTDLYVEMDLEKISIKEVDLIIDHIYSILEIKLPLMKISKRYTLNEFTRIDLDDITHDDIEKIIKLFNNTRFKNYHLKIFSES